MPHNNALKLTKPALVSRPLALQLNAVLGRPLDDHVTSLSPDVVRGADEPPTRVRTALHRAGWAIAATPFLFVIVQVLHAVHLRLLLGRWPMVYRDNPESFLLRVHEYGVLFPLFYAGFFGVPMWAALSVVVAVLLPSARRTIGRQAALVSLGIIVLALFWKFDPTGYVEWFLD